MLIVAWANPEALPAAGAWLVAWLLAPVVAWWVSRPLKSAEPPLTDPQAPRIARAAQDVAVLRDVRHGRG